MYSKQPKYKAVIFDFDDTLVKSHTLKWAHHKAAAKRFYNKDITDEDMQKVWGKPFPLLVETLHSDVDTVENAIKNIRSMDAEFLKETQEDAPHILTQFLDVGIEIGIVSAADGAYVKKDLERLQFPAERFFSIQGCEDTDEHKPDPNVFIPIFKKLQEKGINLNEIVYVGDSMDDVQAAHGAGIDFIGIATGVHKDHMLKDKGAKIVLSHIRELPHHIFTQ